MSHTIQDQLVDNSMQHSDFRHTLVVNVSLVTQFCPCNS